MLEEYSVGRNAPPMHPRCRSTICAVSGEITAKRTAKNAKGENIQIPADMNYSDYKKVYIDRNLTIEQWHTEKIITKNLKIGSSNDIINNKIDTLSPLQKKIKDDEDKAFATLTEKDFGFNKMQGMPNLTKEILYTNGDGKGFERMINCQRCAVAHEARMRGYDVIARPSWGGK